MNALLEGSILGLSLAFIFGFGPAFFALIQTAIHRGFGQGVLLAFGIFLNDLMVVVLTMFGAVSLVRGSDNYMLMGIIGGVLMIIFGLVTFRRKVVVKESEEKENDEPHALVYVAKGFLLNFANPFVWLFWLSVAVSAAAGYEADRYDLVLFFSGTLGVVLITDILKVFTASRLTRFLTDKFLIMINKIAGVALVLFGTFLVIRSVIGF
jgi:threonine/homoserine/homoserine lactone efflux protein